jgi:predicted GNAT family acetyltransferase
MTSVRDNALAHRFELDEAGETAFANYRRAQGRLIVDHVEAPEALRGSGAAGRLMEGVVAEARREGLRITPLCGYAAAWLKRHPEHGDLLG